MPFRRFQAVGRTWRCAWLSAGLGWLGAVASAAAPAVPIIEQYAIRHWGVEDGLPESIVNHITQLSDGFIWLTMPQGVARFDGVRFESLPADGFPAEKPDIFRGLYRDPAGDVWVYGDGGVMRHREGRWAMVPLLDGPAPWRAVVYWVRQAPDGVRWAVTERGLCRFDGMRFVLQPLISPPGGAPPRITGADMDARGVIWMATRDRLLKYQAGAYHEVASPPGESLRDINSIFAGRDHTLWVHAARRLLRLQNGVWEELNPSRMMSFALGSAGESWVGSVEGLFRWQGSEGEQLIGYRNEAPLDIQCVFVGPDGLVWVGARGGLYRLSPRSVRSMGTTAPDQRAGITALWGLPAGGLLCGALGKSAPLIGWPNAMRPLPLRYKIEVSSLAQDGSGKLWIGTQGDYVWSYGLQGESRQYISQDERGQRMARNVTCLLAARNGRVWVGTPEGVMTHDAVKWLVAAGGPVDAITALAEDRQGRIWMGTQRSGLWQIATGGVWQVLSRQTGLPSDTVRLLHCDKEGGLWLGTPAGLVKWEGGGPSNCFTFTRAHGLPDEDIRQLLDDGAGHLWVGTRHMILRMDWADLAAVAAGRRAGLSLRCFGAEEGLHAELSGGDHGPLAVRTDDGRLWFATQAGVAMIDPTRIAPEPPLPPVYIEEVSYRAPEGESQPSICGIWTADLSLKALESETRNAKREPPAAPGGRPDASASPPSAPPAYMANLASRMLRLPPDSRNIAFRFTTPDGVAPERMRFRRRLEGYDADWTPATGERTALYPRLPPGEYRFRVQASRMGGAWQETGGGMAFAVRPYVWQTGWFLVVVGGVAAGLVGGGGVWLVRYRARRQLAHLERIHALDRERARIAQDLHDEIGAALSEIGWIGDMALAPALPAEESRGHVREMVDKVRAMIEALDEIVWAVNPRHDSLRALQQYLGEYAWRFFQRAPQPCRLAVGGGELPDIPLPADVRHQLCLAVKEALHNVARHAHAGVARLEFRTEPERLVIEIADDGRGFDPAAEPAMGADGLRGMRARLARVGGTCEIESRPGAGTHLRFVVPGLKGIGS